MNLTSDLTSKPSANWSSPAIIANYGMGNLRSIQSKLALFQIPAEISDRPKAIEQAPLVILPGVGHFGKGMEELRLRDLIQPLRERHELGKPILGICLGMQLLGAGSDEGQAEGLNIVPAHFKKFEFTPGSNLRSPHVGWNEVQFVNQPDCPMKAQSFYFTHSYQCGEYEPQWTMGVTHHGHNFASWIGAKSTWGFQFHPEKSGIRGLEFLIQKLQVLLEASPTSC